MNKNKLLLIFMLCFTALSSAFAASPVWTFTPLTATTVSVAPSEIATVEYQVTNQSSRVHTLAITTVTGVNQDVSPGNCLNPFVLNGHQSCTLALEIVGSEVLATVNNALAVCEADGGSTQCYQPNLGEGLNIIKTSIPEDITIAISGPVQEDRVIGVDPVMSLELVISNDLGSTGAAENIRAVLPAGWAGVVQDASACTLVAPGDDCTLELTSTISYEPDEVTITADNANNPVTTYVAFREGGGLVFLVEPGIVKVVDESDIFGAALAWYNGVNNPPAGATSLTDGAANTPIVVAAFGNTDNYAAALCENSVRDGYNDWYLPAICELGRYAGVGSDAGCGTVTPNLYTTLYLNGFGDFTVDNYWSSTYAGGINAWAQNFSDATMYQSGVNNFKYTRCARSFVP